MGDPALRIERIYGTSSSNQRNFAVSLNLIAYIASGGVVVAQIDRPTGQCSNERFFCANNANIAQKQGGSAHSNAYSYLNMVQQQQSVDEKDSFGIPMLSQTVVIDEGLVSELSIGNNSPPKGQQQKMKSISCIALSPDEKLLAVGETGTHPRILLFSLAPDSNSFPFLSISEHNFGITALHFSPDSKYLLSVGETHDGFIFLWRLNGLNASIIGVNKCTSQINGVLWHDDNIITYGVRYIKVWKFEEFEKKSMIQGKNFILGNFINGNFVYATPVLNDNSEDDLLILTSLGEICGYSYSTNTLTLRYVNQESERMGVVLSDQYTGNVWIATDTIKQLPASELSSALIKVSDGSIDSPTKVKFTPPIACVEQLTPNFFVFITKNEEIQLFNSETNECTHLIDSLSKNVNGVKKTSCGKIISWTREGVLKSIEHSTLDLRDLCAIQIQKIANKVIDNHITSLDMAFSGDIVTGDAYGNLSIHDKDGSMTFNVQAHELSINNVAFFEIAAIQFIVSIGRDRMIQVFARTHEEGIEDISPEWTIFQTLVHHRGNLLQSIYHNGKLYVSSADRSISIHKFEVDSGVVSIIKEKTISLKSSPTALNISDEELIVSTMDKQLTVFNLNTLESTRSLKLLDEDNDTLLVDNIVVTGPNQIVCSCSDKSIRIFNYLTGRQLCVNWGHSEPIKFLLHSGDHLITLSNTGCLFSWSLIADALLAQTSTVQKYNDITSTPPRAVRKIKKVASQSGSPAIRTTPARRLNTSPSLATRSPTLNNRSPSGVPSIGTRLQSTAKMTPSKLTTSSKTNLSPSPTPLRGTLNINLSSKASPLVKRTSNVLNGNGNLKENTCSIDELIGQLRSFKENIGGYSYDQVQSVKREIRGLFEYEQELMEKYNGVIIEAVKQMKVDK